MAWTYSDWVTQTMRSTRIARLRAHVQEVSDQITAAQQFGEREYDPEVLQRYYAGLLEQLAKLDPTGTGGAITDDPRFAGSVLRGRPV
jgi:hypothetical protein